MYEHNKKFILWQGSYAIIDYYPDMSTFQALLGNAIPYGEYRANLNMTHKTDKISCLLFYVDIVPKSTKKKGRWLGIYGH